MKRIFPIVGDGLVGHGLDMYMYKGSLSARVSTLMKKTEDEKFKNVQVLCEKQRTNFSAFLNEWALGRLVGRSRQ